MFQKWQQQQNLNKISKIKWKAIVSILPFKPNLQRQNGKNNKSMLLLTWMKRKTIPVLNVLSAFFEGVIEVSKVLITAALCDSDEGCKQ